jgi:hypothetical protein
MERTHLSAQPCPETPSSSPRRWGPSVVASPTRRAPAIRMIPSIPDVDGAHAPLRPTVPRNPIVVPAKAGTQRRCLLQARTLRAGRGWATRSSPLMRSLQRHWVPAFAGTTLAGMDGRWFTQETGAGHMVYRFDSVWSEEDALCPGRRPVPWKNVSRICVLGGADSSP